MKHVVRHAVAHARDTMRMPIYWSPAMFFPLLFVTLFGYTAANRLAQLGLGSEYVITPFLLFTTLNVTRKLAPVPVKKDEKKGQPTGPGWLR